MHRGAAGGASKGQAQHGGGHGPGPGKIKKGSIARAREAINSKDNILDIYMTRFSIPYPIYNNIHIYIYINCE